MPSAVTEPRKLRAMSFSMTEPQVRARIKDVTRRIGWWELQPGTRLRAVRKAMGLKKGEKQEVLCEIEVIAARPELIKQVTPDEVRREGFPEMSVEEFVAFFCKGHRCTRDSTCMRIEFRYV
jgi:hypothetical protein